MKLEKRTVKLGSMIPYIRNSKEHTQDQLEQLRLSFVDYGYLQPIVIDENKVIIIGHGRQEGLLSLYPPDTKIDVFMALDVSEEETRTMRILDNQANESPWINDKLYTELKRLEAKKIDFYFYGIDPDEFAPIETNMQDIDTDSTYRDKIVCSMVFYLTKDEYVAVSTALDDIGEKLELHNHSDIFLEILHRADADHNS